MKKQLMTMTLGVLFALSVSGCGDSGSNNTTVNTDKSSGFAGSINNTNGNMTGPLVGFKPSGIPPRVGEVAGHTSGEYQSGRTVGLGKHPETINDSSGQPTNNRSTGSGRDLQSSTQPFSSTAHFDDVHRLIYMQIVGASKNVLNERWRDETSASHGGIRGSEKYRGAWETNGTSASSPPEVKPLALTMSTAWTMSLTYANLEQSVAVVNAAGAEVAGGTPMTNRGPTLNRYGAPRGGTEAYIGAPDGANHQGSLRFRPSTHGTYLIVLGNGQVLANIHVMDATRPPSLSR